MPNQETPNVCEVCQKAFKHPRDLGKHMLTHSAERKFACQACGIAFRRGDHLKRHMKTHSDLVPYVCETCGQSFVLSGDLTQHIRMHRFLNPLTCPTCGRTFVLDRNLRQHIQDAHRDLTDTVMTESHQEQEPVGTVTSTVHTFNTVSTEMTVRYVSSNLGEACVVTELFGSVVTTNIIQSEKTVGYSETTTGVENRTDKLEKIANSL